MVIDPDITVNQLLTQWQNGNKTEVFNALENDHPGLTAMFVTTGCTQRRLTVLDCNILTNILMDRRREKLREQDTAQGK